MKGRKRFAAIGAAVATLGIGAAPAAAATIYGVTASDQLVSFSSSDPGQVSSPMAITGLQASESIEGVDFRPATLELYALASSGRLYEIDTVTGAATRVGTNDVTLDGDRFGFDFNPAIDRIRIVSDAEQSDAVDPNDPAAGNDGPANDLKPPPLAITAAAYTNNRPAAAETGGNATTTLLDIDTEGDRLVQQDAATGIVTPIGDLGIAVGPEASFDIVTDADGTNRGFAVLQDSGLDPARSRLYRINLTTGAATAVAALPATDAVEHMAIAPSIPTFVTLIRGVPQGLATFRADRPGDLSQLVPVSGLQSGERLLGIDTRPLTGQLIGVGSTSRVYEINAETGVAAPLYTAAFTPAVAGDNFGVDFNPMADALRIVSNTDQNLRYIPSTNVNNNDGALDYAEGNEAAPDDDGQPADPNAAADPEVTASGYTNSVASAASTALFGIDSGLDALARQTNPNGGILRTVGALGVDVTGVNGFEILPRFNHQFGAFQVDGEDTSKLFATSVAASMAGQPANGEAVLVGNLDIPAGTLVEGLTALNPDRISFGSATAATVEGGAATLTVVRAAGSTSSASVTVTTGNISAVAPGDYTATTTTVTFAPGETTQSVTIPTAQDTADEPQEVFGVALSDPTGGAALGSPAAAGVVLLDDDPTPPGQTPPDDGPPVYQIPPPPPEEETDRVRPGLGAKVRPKRDRRRPYRFSATGRVRLSDGVSRADGCEGTVGIKITVQRRGRDRTISSRRATVRNNCRFTSVRSFSRKRLRNANRGKRRGTLRFVIRFQGNDELRSRRVVRKARYGRPRN